MAGRVRADTLPSTTPRLGHRFDEFEERCSLTKVDMTIIVKVRHSFGHRWMPFFLPVVASLLFALLATLLVPDSFSGKSKDDADAPGDKFAAPHGSASATAGARRRPRAVGMPPPPAGGIGPAGMAPPQLPPPVAVPASPDGAD